MDIQTRSEKTGLRTFARFEEAYEYALCDSPDVWKISFTLPNGERIRLVRFETDDNVLFAYEPIEL